MRDRFIEKAIDTVFVCFFAVAVVIMAAIAVVLWREILQ